MFQASTTSLAQLQLPKIADTKLITSCSATAGDEPAPPGCALWFMASALSQLIWTSIFDDIWWYSMMFDVRFPKLEVSKTTIDNLQFTSSHIVALALGDSKRSPTTIRNTAIAWDPMDPAGKLRWNSPVFTCLHPAQTLATQPTQRSIIWIIIIYITM